MAGLYRVSASTKNISIGELDRLMDMAVSESGGQVTAKDMIKIPLCFRAIDLIAGAVSRMPYHIWRGQSDVTETETPKKWIDLNYRLCASLLIFNQAYALIEANQYGYNQQWRFLVSPAMKIQRDPATKKLSGFKYDNQLIDNYEKRLLWWWWPNLLDEVGPGSGPTDAALGDASLMKYLTEFADSYFKAGGTPTTIAQKSGPVDPADQDRFESWWTALKAGVKRAFRAILISDKITFQQIGSEIKDTIAPELYEQSAQNVALAYGVPLSKILNNASKYGNAVEQYDVTFITETVLPLYNRMMEIWNERVFEPQGLKIVEASSELEIMQQYELKKAQAVAEIVGGPVLTVDEGRAMMGDYEPYAVALARSQSSKQKTDTQSVEENSSSENDQTDDMIDAERKALKHYAHNRLRDGKPFTFRSDKIGTSEIEAVKACKTHDEIDALKLSTTAKQSDIAVLIDTINAARAELKAATGV